MSEKLTMMQLKRNFLAQQARIAGLETENAELLGILERINETGVISLADQLEIKSRLKT